jgi:hypothetical protein
VVGVTVQERSHVWGSHIIEFLTIGTAVASMDGTHRSVSPELAVELEDTAGGIDPRSIHGVR